MKQIQKRQIIAQATTKRLLGTASSDEERKLEEWLSETSNKQLMDSVLRAEEFAKYTSQLKATNVDKEWQLFVKRYGIDTSITRRNKGIIMLKVAAAVAAVAIIMLTVDILFNNSDRESIKTVAEMQLQPGSYKAELVLVDGNVVRIDTDEEFQLAQDGTTITSNNGTLSYQPANTSKVAAGNNIIRVPRGGMFQLVLPDSSVVWLNSETELEYPVVFGDKERRVKLKGEAYFEVTREEAAPFIVTTQYQDVVVLGTQFNVMAYTDDAFTTTTLVEGQVKVQNSKQTKQFQSILKPGQQSILDNSGQKVLKKNVDTRLFTAWKDDRFLFKQQNLGAIMRMMERWYDVEVVFVDEELKLITFSGDLPRFNNMNQFLMILESEASIDFSYKDKVLYLSTK